ncbi:MAG: hypothetical protein QNJ17_03660 [Desulfocapsaceae bacterium]|nr:hypothetical protein [Desulfocapsaceae bacterium]
MRDKNTPCQRIFLFVAVLIFAAFLSSVNANESAEIDYQRINRNKVVFVVRVSTPPPSSVIVQHYHAGNNALVASSPRAQQVNNRKGYAKWLLKNVSPGVYPFSLTFKNNIRPSDLQLILRYRNPSDGGFRELRTQP